MLSNWNTPPRSSPPFARQPNAYISNVQSFPFHSDVRSRRSFARWMIAPARPCPSSLSRARKFRGLDNDLCDSANCRHRSTVVIVGRIERIIVLTGLRILVLPGSISQKQQHNGTPLVHVTYARININDCIYDNLYGGTNASQLNLSILANVIDHRVFVTTNYAIFPY